MSESHVKLSGAAAAAPRAARPDAAARYLSKKERARLREAALVAAGQDIAPLPAVADPARRAQADASFRFFCDSYFPKLFYLPWSADHLRVIAKIERVVLHDETLAIAMPRGSGKTTLCITAVIWALLTGRHKVALLIGATEESALDLIAKLKGQLSRNRRLEADYPEACYPVRRLGGEARKANGQRYYGIPTQIGWTDSSIVLPTIPNSRCSGAVVRVAGLTAQIRGALEDLADGGFGRPSLVIADDPQTDGSARSVLQTAERLGLLRGAVMGLAAPDRLVGLIVPCTVIQQDDLSDQLLDREKNPDFRGERTKMLPVWPANLKLWEEYAFIRTGELAADGDLTQCVEFYRQRSAPALGRPDCWETFDQKRDCATCPVRAECMDADAVVSWPARKVEGTLSGLHNAMDIWLKVKDAAFAAEFQNEPLRPEELSGEVLTPDAVCARANGRPRGQAPSTTTRLTMFIDVHDKLLFYCVCAWEDNFTGYVIDYGTYPPQTTPMFAMASSTRTLGRMFPGVGPDGAIQAGLESLVSAYLSRDFERGGGLCRIDRLLVDSGYKPGIVSSVRHKVGGTAMMLYRGLGIKASRKPMSSYQKRPGERHGWFWMIPNVRRTGEFSHVAADVNYWKAAVHRNLATAPGEPGSLTIFGQAREHELFAQHIANSEFWVDVTGLGRTVREWSLKPSKPDNHWLDCLVGCAAAASILGVSLPGQAGPQQHGPRRRRVSVSEMMARREARQNGQGGLP